MNLLFCFCSEDIKNQNKIFPWNCQNQEKFIGKGRGNSRILFKHYFPFNSTYRTMPFSLNERYGGTFKCSLRLTSAALSKVAGCWQKSRPAWLVSASYSAWHFLTDRIFWIKCPWTSCLLWQLSHLLQNFLTTVSH